MLPEGTWESVDPDSVQLLAEPSQRENNSAALCCLLTTLLFHSFHQRLEDCTQSL